MPPGLQQHVGEARDRDEVADGVGALRQRRAAVLRKGAAHQVDRAVAHGEAAARQADLAQHAGERDHRPERLLAVMAALQRPVDADRGARRRHLAGKRRDARGGYAGDLLGPRRVLAGERGRELVEAHRVAGEEVAVVQVLRQQRVAERQDQRGVGVGADRQPFDGAAGVEIVGGRRHVDEAHALGAHAVEAALDVMLGGAAGIDLAVLVRHAAEGDEELAVLGHHVPRRVHGHQLVHRRHDVRHQHARGAQAVGILVAHIAADRIQEAMDLALRMMEAAGARPAVGAAEDRAVGMRVLDALQLLGDEIERLVPLDLDEGSPGRASQARRRAFLQPALAHRWPAHAQPRHLVGQHVQADRRGIGILGEGMQARGLAVVVVLDLVDAPMGGGEGALMGHWVLLTLTWQWTGKRSTSAGSVSKAVTSRKARSPGRSDGQG